MQLAQRHGLKGLSGNATRQAASRRATVVVRAEEKSLAQFDRAKNPNSLVFADASSLKYLDGTAPGDLGFDPLGLLDPVNAGGFVTPEWLRYSEVIHCRWAMLGAAGCITPEILGAAGVIPPETGLVWFRNGLIPPAGQYHDYWTDPFSLFLIEVVMIQFAELKRWQDFRYPGSQGKQYFLGLEYIFKGSGNPAYPGGPFFNLFNLGNTEDKLNRYKLAEIKNGRLAMLAMFGYGAQAVLTSKGPFANLVDHLSDPTANNILSNFGKVYGGQ